MGTIHHSAFYLGIKNMNFWRKYHPDIGVDDPRYHQVALIYSIHIFLRTHLSSKL